MLALGIKLADIHVLSNPDYTTVSQLVMKIKMDIDASNPEEDTFTVFCYYSGHGETF